MERSMNNVEAQVLGRRWLAAGGGWPPGMLARFADGDSRFATHRITGDETDVVALAFRDLWWPDFRDGATRGAALEVIREKWESPGAHARQRGSVCRPGTKMEDHDTVPAWEMCDLHLSADAAARIGTKAGSVGCWGYLSEEEAHVAAMEGLFSGLETTTADPPKISQVKRKEKTVKTPPCGMSGCNEPATRADSSGVGFCSTCDPDCPPVSEENPFDPWWFIAALNPEAFKDLNYGEFPPGWAESG